jgi:site-specific recombinase XerD
MKVTIKKRKITGDRSSIYLEISEKGIRTRESLELIVYDNPKTKLQDQENKATMDLAEQLKVRRVIELQDRKYGTNRQDFSKRNFVAFFEAKTEDRKESQGNYGNWDSALKHFKACFGEVLAMADINMETAEKFKNYLKDEAKTKSDNKLSQNSLYSYYNKFKACIRLAYKERMLRENWAEYMKGFAQGECFREYLTFKEVQALVGEQCRYPVLKNAFLFSCLTGLRWSDIQKLTWSQIRFNEKRGNELIFRQQKTKGMEYLPISEQALELMGSRGNAVEDDRIFKGLKYSAYMNVGLFEWIARAGIKKKITFHCARHTNACLLLENGTDIYTVSKMLGHRELKTTQIYAKIVDSKKMDAVNSFPKLDFNNRKHES